MASVLFDEPGPTTRTRHRIYSAIFLVLLAALVTWVVMRLQDSGAINDHVFGDLTQDNILRALGQGVVATLKAAGLGILGAVVLGLLLVFARMSDHRWVRLPAVAFTEFFRAVPLLLLILFLYFLLAEHIDGTEARGLAALALGLTLYNGTVLAEVFRAGINAVAKGQSEAAYAIGMRKNQVMRIVLVPQAVRFMLPAIISQCVIVLKDTSLGFVVVYPELLRESKNIADFVDNQLMTYAFAALIYITLNSILGLTAQWLERRASRSSNGQQIVKQTEAALPMT